MKPLLKIIVFLFLLLANCHAAPVSFEPFYGKLSPKTFTPLHTPEEYWTQGEYFFEARNYHRAMLCFSMISHHFPHDAHAAEALLLTGKCYLKAGQPDLADKALTAYLNHPEADFSKEVFEMKFTIAKHFASGKRKHLFSLEGFPKIADASEDALRLFDEVLTAFPDQDLGAQALYCKVELLIKKRETQEAIKHLKKITLQFPFHELSPQAFLKLSEIYLNLAKQEPYNEAYLQQARLNASTLSQQHPNHPYNQTVSANIHAMCDRYASSLYSTGRFYEKQKKRQAARIYYLTALRHYPHSSYVAKCQRRLDRIAKRMS